MRRSDAFLTNMAAAIVALSVGGTIRAQVTPQDAKTIATCAGISSDLQRLSCYDDLSRQVRSSDTAQNKTSSPPENSAAAPAAMAPAVTAAGSRTNSEDSDSLGAWVRNDEVDGLDNSKIVVLSLPAQSGNVGLIGKSGVKRGPVLVLRCKERQAQIFVSFDLPVTGSEDAVPVLYRIGTNAPTKGVWSRSEDETSFGSWQTSTTAQLVNQLEPATDFFVRAAGSNGRTSEALFKLDGIKAAAKSIQEGCPW
ncbi:type VI secretion system-associated protein TagO [Bradyrhizobium sp.]|uniref:type VI secretion system-associated protein TagO n=1 Tax=Bradyrhizobium sp. TaxID=376 RepID=UPI002BC71C39|nr:type VI secretion system-associated protein TagO [Bradyrhizobium sp.]HWX62335.1 type VI secretion system-associated protein TagO [Bradyrhizobium sp.]